MDWVKTLLLSWVHLTVIFRRACNPRHCIEFNITIQASVQLISPEQHAFIHLPTLEWCFTMYSSLHIYLWTPTTILWQLGSSRALDECVIEWYVILLVTRCKIQMWVSVQSIFAINFRILESLNQYDFSWIIISLYYWSFLMLISVIFTPSISPLIRNYNIVRKLFCRHNLDEKMNKKNHICNCLWPQSLWQYLKNTKRVLKTQSVLLIHLLYIEMYGLSLSNPKCASNGETLP